MYQPLKHASLVPLHPALTVGHHDFYYIFPFLSSALRSCLSCVNCDSLLFPSLFPTGFPLLHTSFGYDSAGKRDRFARLCGVQKRM